MLGRWTRLKQELNFDKDPLHKGGKKVRETRKKGEREEKREKPQPFYLNKLT